MNLKRRPTNTSALTVSLFAAAMLLAADGAAESLPTDLEELQGWWRYDDPQFAWGCQDTDGQYRVAIGRWIDDDSAGKIVFGVGAEQKLGFYDAACVLSNKTHREAATRCTLMPTASQKGSRLPGPQQSR
ncbi:hypothetical protein F2Q65_12910 [Thiohalocapsa marina]|uniref:Uncharacterized protein n=1 Tax=Thiohalocapsa marina TaxID=424902 RepID=A0A5M8FH55_9GAMM|nr:hypothetical protein [Thiohalocapsa marina]KAA6184213.1 hypothetical protein F2Q65_12910 [Thiohalocapsa marina]